MATNPRTESGAFIVEVPSAPAPRPTAELTREEKDRNLLAIATLSLREIEHADYPTRRRGVMYVASVLGHKMGPAQLREQPWGVVGQCDRCGQVAKAPRHTKGLEGRAVTNVCPSVPR